MLDDRFVFVGLAISIYGGATYLINTLKGKTKPNKITWFIWALAPLIAFSAEIKQGVGLQSLLTFIFGFNPLLIFLASFVNKNTQWKIGKLDIFCGILALFGLIAWQITKVGNVAILFSILADGLGGIPTVIKAYKAPETENYKVFLCAFINSAITLMTIKTWNFAHWAFPVYVLFMSSTIFTLVRFKLGKKFI